MSSPRIIMQKKSGAWWKVLLGFLGGFVVGVGGVVGGVAAAGAYFKSGEIISLTGQDPNKILTEEYQNKTILDIVTEAVGGKIKINTLGDIAAITPLLDEYVINLSDQLNELGTSLSIEEIYSWPLTELSDNLISSVKDVELISFLSKNNTENPSPIVKFICYQTDSDGEYVTDAEGKLIDLKLKDLMDDSSFLQDKIDSMKIKTLFTEEQINNSGLLKAIQNKTVKQLSESGAFDDVLIADIIGDSSSKIITAFKRDNVTVGNIGSAINNLYLDDVLEYDNYDTLPSVLKKLLAKDTYGVAPGVPVTTNPFSVKRMVFDSSTGYPLEYNYVIFSNGEEGDNYQQTDYIPITRLENKSEIGFIYKDNITLNADLSYSFSGNHPRDVNCEDVVINITNNTGWSNLYALSCNKPAKVNELSSSIDNLQLKDVLSIKQTDSLWKVRNEVVKDGDALFTSIKNNLTLEDIVPDYTDIKLLKSLDGTTPIKDIGDAINNLKIVDAFEDNIYDGSGNLNKTWKYMLIESGETWIEGSPNKSANPLSGYNCENYTVGGDGMDKLVENMTNNMERTTIRQLYNDGMVSVDSSFIGQDIPSYFAVYLPASATARGATLYGDLTIKEFTEMISSFTAANP